MDKNFNDGSWNCTSCSADIITDGLFSVGPMSGDATVQGTLDRELNNIYSFGVDVREIAMNSGYRKGKCTFQCNAHVISVIPISQKIILHVIQQLVFVHATQLTCLWLWISTFQAYIVDPSDTSVIKSETAIAFVVVTVTDVNDNPPTFLNSRYSSYVTEAAQPGHIVVSTSAFDLDEVRSGISYLAHNLPCTL